LNRLSLIEGIKSRLRIEKLFKLYSLAVATRQAHRWHVDIC